MGSSGIGHRFSKRTGYINTLLCSVELEKENRVEKSHRRLMRSPFIGQA